MPYVRDSFWRGREFTSLAQMQTDAVRWSGEVAGTRACRPLDGAAPAAVFAAVEASALRPLPTTAFVLAAWSTGKVGPDIHVKVGKALYSAPWALIGAQVHARATATTVQIIADGKVVATHVIAEKGRRTNFDHYPPEKIAFHMRTPTWCRRTALQVGPACVQVMTGLLFDNALYRLRAAQGVLGLRERYTPARLEAACARAVEVGDPSYRTIKGILVAGTETSTSPTAADNVADVPAFLRGPQDLFSTADTEPAGLDGPALATVITLPSKTTTGSASETTSDGADDASCEAGA